MAGLPQVPGFALQRVIGSGGMGAVYAAIDERSGQRVAVKVLSTSQVTEAGRRRFEREARATLSVQHENVCAAYDFGALDDGRLFIAMELLDGEDLGARLARDGRLPPSLAVRIVRDAGQGLARAHSRGLVHRDVKPGNIFLVRAEDDGQETVKVLDFGLAVFAHGDGHAVTRTGEVVGTPGFMAPEQARGGRPVDGRADVFSLGAVLYTVIAGVPPFGSDGPIAVVVRMLTQDARPLCEAAPEVPAALGALVDQALQREPEHRPESMDVFVRRLDELLPSLSDQLPAIALADTDQVQYEAGALDDEQRVVTAMLANGVIDVRNVVGAIQQHGGTAAVIGGGQVVGLFGADESDGDEADRAVLAALQVESHCRVIGIGTGRTVPGRGRLAEDAVQTAAGATEARDHGVLLDPQTRRRVQTRWRVDGPRVLGPAIGDRRLELTFVGRDADLAELTARMNRAFDEEEVGGVLLLGAAGVGKSRLVTELVAAMADRDVRVLRGRGESSRRYTAWHALGGALRYALDVGPRDPAAAVRAAAWLAARVAEIDEPSSLFLSACLGVSLPEDVSFAVDNARRDPTVLRDQIVTAVGDVLEGWAALSPVLVVLEDVQWADSASLELLQIALERCRDRPVYVVMTGRPHAFEERHELLDSPSLDRRLLRELSRRACMSLAAEAFGGYEPTPAMLEAIADHSAGNPFFVQEIVAHVLSRATRSTDPLDPNVFTLPLNVEAAVQSRLDHLPAGDKDLLKRASVFGERFWREALEQFGGPDPGTSLQRLYRSGFLRRPSRRDQRMPGCEEYAFEHLVVQQVAYGMLTEQQRQMLHLAAGRWLADRDDAPASEGAAHLGLGGDRRGAQQQWQRAAEQARHDGDLSAVLHALEQALEEGASGSETAPLRLEQARAAVDSGRYDVAEQALAALPDDGPHDQALELQLLGRVLRVRGEGTREERHRAAHSMFDQACRRYLERGDSAGASRALACLATSERYGGLGDGLEAAARATTLAGDDPTRRSRALAAQSLLYLHDGDLLRARNTAREGLEAARAAGDLGSVVSLLGDLAYAQMTVGEYASAVSALREVIERGRKLGAASTTGYAWHNLGLALLRAGEADEALDAEDRALDMAAEAGNSSLAAYCQLYRSLILLELGRLDDATHAARSALLATASSGDEPAVRTALAMIYQAAGGHAEALLEADQAYALRVQTGRMLEFELDLLWIRGTLLLDAGRDAEGQALLDEARQLLDERAGTLTDEPELRERFLGAVPLHRAIVRLTTGAE